MPEDRPEGGPDCESSAASSVSSRAQIADAKNGSGNEEPAPPSTGQEAGSDGLDGDLAARTVEGESGSSSLAPTSEENAAPTAPEGKKRKRRRRLTPLEILERKRQEQARIDLEVRTAETNYRKLLRKADEHRTFTLGGGLRGLVAAGDEQARQVYIRIVDHKLKPKQVEFFDDWLPAHWRPEWPVPELVRKKRKESERGSGSGGQDGGQDGGPD